MTRFCLGISARYFFLKCPDKQQSAGKDDVAAVTYLGLRLAQDEMQCLLVIGSFNW